MTALNVFNLSRSYTHNPHTGANIKLEDTVIEMRSVIELMMHHSIIAQRDSFGYALACPNGIYVDHWDDPSTLIGLVVWWGPEGPRYAANACRKIRAAAREGMNTESIRLHYPERFRNTIESVDSVGLFNWGDFPYDGATYVEVQDLLLLGAVSALPQEQDSMIARLITNQIGLKMLESDQRLVELLAHNT